MKPGTGKDGMPVRMYFKIKERSWIAKLAAWKLNGHKTAIVIGKTIHLHNTTTGEFLQNKRWLRHELEHLKQFRQFGYIRFIFLYLLESLLHGYFNNKYEREARYAEREDLPLPHLQLTGKKYFITDIHPAPG